MGKHIFKKTISTRETARTKWVGWGGVEMNDVIKKSRRERFLEIESLHNEMAIRSQSNPEPYNLLHSVQPATFFKSTNYKIAIPNAYSLVALSFDSHL